MIRGRTAAEWTQLFAGRDVCACIVATVEEALADPQFAARGLFTHRLWGGGREIAALPVPIDAAFRNTACSSGYPSLGDANGLLPAAAVGS